MTTELISLNECRKNLSTIWKKAQKENKKYIVLVHSKPVMEIKPIYDNKIEEVEPNEWEKKATEEYEKEKKEGTLETVEINFDKILNEDDFVSVIKSKNV